VTDVDRGRAWTAIHEQIARMPSRAVGPCTCDGDDDAWHVAAVDLKPRGRQTKREPITATGATEIAAPGVLVELLGDRAAR
jgi:hypothetical protein